MKPNEAKTLLKKQFDENKNSHVFLVETNNQDNCLLDIKDLIKDILKADSTTKLQIDEESYIELIILRPDGKDIKKDAILMLQERLKTKPILSDKMLYIIIPAESLNEIAANKLLKTIEEPNQNNIGFLITSNSSIILPTIKSRCETITMLYDEDTEKNSSIDEEVHEITKSIIRAIESSNHIDLYRAKSNDKIIKENFKIIEKLLISYYNTACKLTKDEKLDKSILDLLNKNSYRRLIKKTKYINSVFNKLTKNMNNDLLLEKIFFELRDVK